MIFFTLFYEFVKIGLFSIGGGMATLPFLVELADRRGWYTQAELLNMIAVSESTPGPIGINMATYVGFTAGSEAYGLPGGVLGSVIATLAIILPSVFIVLIIARMLTAFKEHPFVQRAFYGLRPAVAALIAAAAISIAIVTVVNINAYPDLLRMVSIKPAILFAVLLVTALRFKKIQPLHMIAAAAAAGIIFKM
jgi:chromate transporter